MFNQLFPSTPEDAIQQHETAEVQQQQGITRRQATQTPNNSYDIKTVLFKILTCLTLIP